jgi:hypothetical protein
MQIEQNIFVALPQLDIQISHRNREFKLHAIFMSERPEQWSCRMRIIPWWRL